jgi:hypothetical protein
MAHPQDVDGGESLIWRIAANFLNKHSQEANKGWSSSLGIVPGFKNRALDLTHSIKHGNESLGSRKRGEFLH